MMKWKLTAIHTVCMIIQYNTLGSQQYNCLVVYNIQYLVRGPYTVVTFKNKRDCELKIDIGN